MTKKEIVHRIADRAKLPKAVAREVIQSFLDEIVEELVRAGRLEFREFGVFEVRERAARKAQNPQTMQSVQIPPKLVVKFKAGSRMKERVAARARRASSSGSSR